MINQSLEESAIGWGPPILLERDVPIVLSDGIGQDFEMDLPKRMGFLASVITRWEGMVTVQLTAPKATESRYILILACPSY